MSRLFLVQALSVLQPQSYPLPSVSALCTIPPFYLCVDALSSITKTSSVFPVAQIENHAIWKIINTGRMNSKSFKIKILTKIKMKKLIQEFIQELLEIMIRVGFDLILEFLRDIVENWQ